MLRDIVKTILRPVPPSAWCYICGKFKGHMGCPH